MGNKASTAEGKEKSLQGEETPSESRKEAHFEMEEETSSDSEWDTDSESDVEIVEEEDDDDDDENEEEVVTHVLAPAEGSPCELSRPTRGHPLLFAPPSHPRRKETLVPSTL
jgi:hypothetical protein